MAKIKFRTSSSEQFLSKHKEAYDTLDDLPINFNFGINSFAEVKIPGHGWCPCILGAGTPRFFWDEDDGWNPVPPNVEFKEV